MSADAAGTRACEIYFLAPRLGFFNRDCRSLPDLRFGLLMMKVPLP
jgi:hypothetical protein